jgi:hypothetical protein
VPASLTNSWNSLVAFWNSTSSELQAAIVAASASILVSIIAQAWSPITQRKLERKKAEFQADLESTKARLQKELEDEKARAQVGLEQLKSNLAKDLERTKDSIEAQNQRIEILTNAKKRWKASDSLAPDNATLMAAVEGKNKDAAETAFKWIVAHGNNCRDIFDEIKFYLSDHSIKSINEQLDEISKDLSLLAEYGPNSEKSLELSPKTMLKNYKFSMAVGRSIDSEIERLVKSRLTDDQTV